MNTKNDNNSNIPTSNYSIASSIINTTNLSNPTNSNNNNNNLLSPKSSHHMSHSTSLSPNMIKNNQYSTSINYWLKDSKRNESNKNKTNVNLTNNNLSNDDLIDFNNISNTQATIMNQKNETSRSYNHKPKHFKHHHHHHGKSSSSKQLPKSMRSTSSNTSSSKSNNSSSTSRSSSASSSKNFSPSLTYSNLNSHDANMNSDNSNSSSHNHHNNSYVATASINLKSPTMKNVTQLVTSPSFIKESQPQKYITTIMTTSPQLHQQLPSSSSTSPRRSYISTVNQNSSSAHQQTTPPFISTMHNKANF